MLDPWLRAVDAVCFTKGAPRPGLITWHPSPAPGAAVDPISRTCETVGRCDVEGQRGPLIERASRHGARDQVGAPSCRRLRRLGVGVAFGSRAQQCNCGQGGHVGREPRMGRNAGLLHRQLSSRTPIRLVEKERKSSRYATAIAAPRPEWLHAWEPSRNRWPVARTAFFCVVALGKDGRWRHTPSVNSPYSVSMTVFFT